MTIPAGTRIGRYEIRSPLGAGGMGEVYLAEDVRLHRMAALKVLPADIASNEDRMRRFALEAEAAAALNHPNIAHIYEIAEHDGVTFIAMEFVDGSTLRTLIDQQPTELRKVLRHLQHVAEGLAKAHASGIVHRDLKPDNVMITRDGHAKILDFGLAKLVERASAAGVAAPSEAATAVMSQKSTPGTLLGTVGYMSPEQAQGKPEIDQRSDIFSFGCILFEAVTGRRPFDGDSVIQSLHRTIYEPAPAVATINPTAPPELQRIVRRCLAKDPEERYQTIKDVAIELKEVRREMDDGGRQAPRTTAAPDSSPSSSSSAVPRATWLTRRKVAATVVVLALASAGLAYILSSAGQPQPPARFQTMKMTRVTTEGNVESAAVSPDGKYVAYSLEESGKRSLWTKHLGSGSRVQIVPTSEAVGLNASSFSADGGYVYYTRIDDDNPQGVLYEVPVLGGTSRRIISAVVQPVSHSPGGAHVAFGRYHLKGPEDEIFIADADGANERRLLSVKEPDWLGASTPVWSPDGKLLAVSYGSDTRNVVTGQPLGMTVAVVPAAGGALTPIAPPHWLYSGTPAWFSDGSGLAVIARETSLGAPQIWQISYPQGRIQRITSDLNAYGFFSLTLTADSSALVAVQSSHTSNIWIAPASDFTSARALTSGKNVLEGTRGLTWTPDGKVLYESNVNGRASIWIASPDRAEPRAMTDSSEENTAPEVSADGRDLFFGSLRTGGNQVWRMSIDGANPKQLTRARGGIPTFSLSPDGRWIVYNPFTGGISKLSVDGGDPVELISRGGVRYPQVSPDGTLLAYFADDEKTHRQTITVVRFDNGTLVRSFELPITSAPSLYDRLFYHGFHWSPDGRGLVYIDTFAGVSNLWRQPLDGGQAIQLTNFTSGRIFNFAYSRDGRQIAFARGNQTSDAVLISEAR
jgi:eukaryotic-like serine/threonine-protein kinase